MEIVLDIRRRRTFAAGMTHLGAWICALAACGGDPGTEADDGAATEPIVADTEAEPDASETGSPGESSECDASLGEGACAELDVCEAFECGGKTAPFNHFGCPRTACADDAECGADERCFAVALDTGCRAAAVCEDADGTCACGAGALACAGIMDAHCLPTGFYPASGDCEVEGLPCEELALRANAVEAARLDREALGHAELASALQDCGVRVDAAMQACEGSVAP